MGYVCYHNALQLALRGHDVTVFTLDHRRLPCGKDPSSFKVVRLHTPLLYGDAGAVPQLSWRLDDFDVVHLHYPFYGGAEYVYLASVLRKKRYLLTYHMDVHGNDLFKKLILGGYEPLLTRRIIRGASAIGALSIEHLQSSRVAPYIDWGRVIELPNGVDAELFRPRAKDLHLIDKFKLAGKTVVLFVGNLQPFKGLGLLIEAIAQLKKPDVVLLVVGGGYGEERYRNQVRELKLGDRVIFAGPQSPKDELPAYYNLGDFLVLPSTHSESFGLVVLEAMSSGIPAIVSSLPGLSQVVEQGRDGLVAQVGDRLDLLNNIELLLESVGLRVQMGAAARDKVMAKYRWEKVGDMLEKALLRIRHAK
jgi:glycosyltransferase involved in cell wall biosynthesis